MNWVFDKRGARSEEKKSKDGMKVKKNKLFLRLVLPTTLPDNKEKKRLPRSVDRGWIDITNVLILLIPIVVDGQCKGRWVNLVEDGRSVLVVVKDGVALLPGAKELERERDRLHQGVVKLLCARHVVVAARLGLVIDLGKVFGF